MIKASPGKPYVVVSGDTLTRIASQAYGDPAKWSLIWSANKTTLRSGDPNKIFPGEVINVPQNDVEIKSLDLVEDYEILDGKSPNEFTIKIDDSEINVDSAEVIRTMDTVADGFTAVIPWDPSDKKRSKILSPYGYKGVSVYIGKYLVLRGKIYITTPSIGEDGVKIQIDGFSSTVDIVDSSVIPPYEQQKVTLKTRAETLLEPFGIGIIYDAEEGDVFDRVTASKTDKVFDHLLDLASQRSTLISSTIKGSLIFYNARKTKPVGILMDNFPPNVSSSVEFNGRNRFFTHRVIGPTPKRQHGRNGIEAISHDTKVPRARFSTVDVGDSTPGNIQGVADWNRSKSVAGSIVMSYPVSSWYAPDGLPWRENTIVTVQSDVFFIPDGFDFLIRSVKYKIDSEGVSAVLDLVPPSVYTGEEVDEPW